VKIKNKPHEKYAFITFENDEEATAAIEKYLNLLSVLSVYKTRRFWE
jgi:hypothetical protein